MNEPLMKICFWKRPYGYQRAAWYSLDRSWICGDCTAIWTSYPTSRWSSRKSCLSQSESAGLTVRNLCPGGYLHTTHAYHSCHSDCRPGHTHGDPSDSTHDTHSKPTRNRPLLLRTWLFWLCSL